MSYEVLARRLRPHSFAEVVGQEHVTLTLRSALRSGRLPHAILLCGPRGVGKTSIARVLARSLNCDSGPTESPCGRCSACLEIASGKSLDVQEIDAASHTGVDNVREIRDSVRYSAAPGKHRIFIIDEVHMLSSAAFNALLKTLEEPPPRSLFVLATTDPQKIPATVLSRVQRFDLRRLGQRELLTRLRAITDTEGLEVSDAVLRGLIREGAGSFRDVLTLLERLVSGLGKQIRDEDARRLLDWTERRVLEDLLDPILARDPAGVFPALERALDKGSEPARLGADLLALLRDLLVARLVPEPGALLDASAEELAELRRRAESSSPEALQQLFRVLLTRLADLPQAPNPAHALEVALVRLATLPDTASLAALLQRIDGVLASPGGGPEPETPGRGEPPRRSAPEPRSRPAPEPTPRGGSRASATAPDPTAPPEPQHPVPAAAVPAAAVPAAAVPAAAVPAAAVPAAAVPAAAVPAAAVPAAAVPAAAAAGFAAAAPVAPAPPPKKIATPAEPPPAAAAKPQVAEPMPRRAATQALSPELQQRLHMEAKTHPAVLAVIDTLDAEIREIRMPRR